MRTLLPLVCVLLIGLVATTAYADDAEPTAKPKSAVGALKPDELAALEKRLPKPLSSYTAEEQERIARGVLRLRNLTPEQRAKLKQRMDEALAAKRAGVDLDKKFAAMRRNRSHYDASFKIGKGVGQLLRASLDDATKQKLAELPGRLRGRHLDMMFSRLYIENVIAATEDGVMKLDASTLPERMQKPFEAKRAKVENASPEKAERYKRHLAHLVVTGKVMQLLEGIERPKRKDFQGLGDGQREAHRRAYEAYFRAVGEKAKATWPDAFDATVVKIRDLADDPAELAQLLVRQASRGRDGRDGRQRPMSGVYSLLMLDRQLRGLPSESELRVHLNALIRGLLVERHKLDPAKVDAAMAKEGRERSKAFRELFKGMGDGRGNRWPGRGNGRPGGRDRPK
ncbi:MAG: hypothetical protein QNJ98_13100 [Planctomycetota bacterium]|nr:hypothetical protein [Planctomycetota bacterium]